MLGLDELEFKCIQNCKHVENYEGYSYSVYELADVPLSEMYKIKV